MSSAAACPKGAQPVTGVGAACVRGKQPATRSSSAQELLSELQQLQSEDHGALEGAPDGAQE